MAWRNQCIYPSHISISAKRSHLSRNFRHNLFLAKIALKFWTEYTCVALGGVCFVWFKYIPGNILGGNEYSHSQYRVKKKKLFLGIKYSREKNWLLSCDFYSCQKGKKVDSHEVRTKFYVWNFLFIPVTSFFIPVTATPHFYKRFLGIL